MKTITLDCDNCGGVFEVTTQIEPELPEESDTCGRFCPYCSTYLGDRRESEDGVRYLAEDLPLLDDGDDTCSQG